MESRRIVGCRRGSLTHSLCGVRFLELEPPSTQSCNSSSSKPIQPRRQMYIRSTQRDTSTSACAAAQGFALIDPATRKLNYVSKPLPPDHAGFVRFNDGACDSRGRFFAGTIRSTDPYIPGQLYRYDPTTDAATLVDPGPFTVRKHYWLR